VGVTHGGDIFGVARARGVEWQQLLDFSASINPLGPSVRSREAILASVDRIAHYPCRAGLRLRRRLAEEWQLPPERILVGNGATDLLFAWCRHVGPGTIAAPAFSEFHRAWPGAPLCQLADPATWPALGPSVITRPANPTGTVVDAATVLTFARGRRDPVLVDESFLDFVDGAESLLPHACGNLFVLRSLTKFWALPGLRVGALAGEVAEIQAQGPPWSLNALAEEAMLAALDDTSHASRTRAFVAEEARWLRERLTEVPGLRIWPATANYLFLETGSAAERTAHALERGVLIRDCRGWPGLAVEGVRTAVRRRWENEILVRVFQEFSCA